MDDLTESLRQAKADLITGLVLLGVAALATWSILSNERLIGVNYGADPGPALLPALLVGLLVLCALWMVATSALTLWRWRHRGSDHSFRGTLGDVWFPVLIVATLVVYLPTMLRVGFLPTTLGFATFWAIAIGIQDKGRPRGLTVVLYVGEAVALTVGIYLIFERIIQVPLP